MKTKYDFIKLGVLPEKIIESEQPNFIYNLRLKKIMYRNDCDLLNTPSGGKCISIKNNIMIASLCYSELSKEQIEEMNNGGVFVINHDKYYRFAFVPQIVPVEIDYSFK